MTSPVSDLTLALGMLGATLGCNLSPTNQTFEILQHQAQWTGQNLTAYDFVYSVHSMVNSPCYPVALHIVVRADTVVSATCIASGQTVQGITVTVNTLFADALRAAHSDDLDQVQFDSRLGFPTLVAVAGPPDAGWSEQVTNFQP
jgi:hypothetical protein